MRILGENLIVKQNNTEIIRITTAISLVPVVNLGSFMATGIYSFTTRKLRIQARRSTQETRKGYQYTVVIAHDRIHSGA